MKKIIIFLLGINQISCNTSFVSLNQRPYEAGQVGIVSYHYAGLKGLTKKRRVIAFDYMKQVCSNFTLVREYNTNYQVTTGYNTKRSYDGSYQTTPQGGTGTIRVIEFRCK